MKTEYQLFGESADTLKHLTQELKRMATDNTRTADYVYSAIFNAIEKIVEYRTGKRLPQNINWYGNATWFDDLIEACNR